MDSLRKFLLRFNHGDNNRADETILNGPTIGINPGQVKEDVHYMEARGDIDLSYLRFYAEDYFQETNDRSDFDVQNNTTIYINEDIDSISSENNNINTFGAIESFLDIVVFDVPEHCTSRNCDLSKFGIGSLTHMNGVSYLSLCRAGRLELDHNIFDGHHTQLMIPSEGPMPDRIKQNKHSKFSMPQDRHYEVMLANCHERGRRVHVMGQVVFNLVDSDAIVENLTSESSTILVLVAFAVFALLTILAIRINWGTRADFEQQRYGLVPDTDNEQVNPTDNDASAQDNEEEVADSEVEEHGNSSGVTQATIV